MVDAPPKRLVNCGVKLNRFLTCVGFVLFLDYASIANYYFLFPIQDNRDFFLISDFCAITVLHVLAILSLGLVVLSRPFSYQHVKFLREDRSRPRSSTFRPSRSFGFSSHELYSSTPEDIWQQVLDPSGPSGEALSFETHNGHITPDFSNGLDYEDPFLLTGAAAKRAASILYRKSLFFGDVNHIKSLLYLQEQRKRSGLAGNNLGSLRPQLPWYRFKKNFNFFK